MACSKYKLINPGSSNTYFNYKKCSDTSFQNQTLLSPGQTKNIWLQDSSYVSVPSFEITVEDEGVFPPPPPSPIGQSVNQTWLAIAPNVLNSFTYSILDWTNQRIIPNIDLGIDNGDWNYNLYSITNQGYSIVFYDNSNNYQTVFMDSFGTIVETYSATTNSQNYDNLDGVWFYFDDQQNGVFKYFNGSYVGTFNYDPSYQSIGIDWSYYAVISTGSFSITVTNTTGDTATVKLLSVGVEQDIKTYDTLTENVEVLKYFDGDFFALITSNASDEYVSLEIYDSSGTTRLQNISLTGDTYTNRNSDFYGTNKLTISFYNGSDGDVDYLVYNYNGNTDTLLTTSLDRGNHLSYNTYYEENFYPNRSPSENMYIITYGSNNYINGMDYCDYLSVTSFINNSSTIDTYILQDSGDPDKGFGLNYVGTTNTLFLGYDDGDGILSIKSFNDEGETTVSTGLEVSGITTYWSDTFGDNYFVSAWETCCNLGTSFIYGSDGQERDSLSFSGGSINYDTNYNTLIITNGTDSWYVNNQNTGFTQMDFVYNTSSTQQSCYIPTFTYNGTIVAANYDTNEMKIITPSTVSDTITYPTNNGRWSFLVGTSYFMYLYDNSSTDLIISDLYDFNGNVVNTINTSSIDDDCDDSVDTRFFYNVQIGNTHTWYMFSPETSASVSMYTGSGWNKIANDYFY
jgi:hypothetical protein